MIKKIGIVADTHDNIDKIDKIIEIFNREKVDLVIHAGDIISPFSAVKFNSLDMDFIAIYGNNDGEIIGLKNILQYKIFESPHIFRLRDLEILIIHKPDMLSSLSKSGEYDIIIYGHTHQPDVRLENDKTLIINPGEGCGYLTGKATVAILDIAAKHAEIIEVI